MSDTEKASQWHWPYIISATAKRFSSTLLITGKDLRFKPIIFFYSTTIVIFTKLYFSLFFFEPTLFQYENPIMKPEATLQSLTMVTRLYQSLDFGIYAACTMAFMSYPRIASNSMTVSAVNVIQALYSLVIVSLLVATVIQKTNESKQKRKRE